MTPVYVQSGGGPGLIDVLVAGYEVNNLTAQELKEATGGSDFTFVAGSGVVASTLAGGVSSAVLTAANRYSERPGRITDGGTEYMALTTPLMDVLGHPIGKLSIFRSFATADQRLESLRLEHPAHLDGGGSGRPGADLPVGATHIGARETAGSGGGGDCAGRL